MQLNGKVVLITGASQGIGAACADAFARRGALLSLTARRFPATTPAEYLVTSGDLTDAGVRRTVVDRTLERYGRIDVLVNNAGVGLYQPAYLAAPLSVRSMFELNFFAALDMIQLVSPHMKKLGSGTVVNVSSIAGKLTLPWFTVYSASKAALCALTDGIRTELSHDGIHAISVCPGYVRSGFQQHVLEGKPPELVGRMRKWAIAPERCAEDLVRGVERDLTTVVTPRSGWLLIGVARLLPSVVERQLAKIYFKDHTSSAEVRSVS